MNGTEKIGAGFAVLCIGLFVIGCCGALQASIKADKKYCMEQTIYEYNDCIVKIQG
tara:strand:- start:520 stop:687 length:168 start_codon:yes stop_codon:yes gene_type:complete